jgi:hypothetical protein
MVLYRNFVKSNERRLISRNTLMHAESSSDTDCAWSLLSAKHKITSRNPSLIIYTSHLVVVIDIADIPRCLPICPDKLLVSRWPFCLRVAG